MSTLNFDPPSVPCDNPDVAEHYLNVLTFRLRGYTGHPLPSNLSEELTLEIDIGQRIDVERLVREVGEDVGGGPRRISYSVTETAGGRLVPGPN